MNAQQMWANYQQYPGYTYPYGYHTGGYPPYGAATMPGGPPYAQPMYGGYGNYAPPQNGAYAPHPHLGAQPRYGTAGSNPTAGENTYQYGLDGPPTKKRLTVDNSSVSSLSSSSVPSSGPKSGATWSAAPVSTPTAAPTSRDWPPSLLKFVTRCYESTPAHNVALLEQKLAEIIKLAESSQTLWSRDWDAIPVPVLPPAPTGAATSKNLQFDFSSSSAASKTGSKSKLAQKGTSSSTPSRGNTGGQGPTNKKASKKATSHSGELDEEARKEMRASRFSVNATSSASYRSDALGYGYQDAGYDAEDSVAIVGTCTNLEKPYLRLTERPVPSSVRPVAVLKQSLELMRKKKKEGASWKTYLGEQMKSIRQDLVIQAIADEFALEVYETNARWCLENDDVAEFKRCLLRIDEFYHHLDLTSPNLDEFVCYSLLYHLLSEDFPSLNAELATINPESKKHNAIFHAIRICESYLTNNWHQFFLLSKTSYFLEKHILDIVSDRIRIHALESIFISYVLSIALIEPPYHLTIHTLTPIIFASQISPFCSH